MKKKTATLLSRDLRINSATYMGEYKFLCKHACPVYEITSVHALNQLIGYAKFINQDYGKVLYRGEHRLHKELKPTAFRSVNKVENTSTRISKLLNRVIADKQLCRELKVDKAELDLSKYKIEGLLQHYGVRTRFVDLVDNHWIALWMGLNKVSCIKKINDYYHYNERQVSVDDIAGVSFIAACREYDQGIVENYTQKDTQDIAKRGILNDYEDLFQYILLLAIPYARKTGNPQSNTNHRGVYLSKGYVEIDLRQALPSQFLRPHAQHGIVVKRIVHTEDQPKGAAAYDIAPSVVGIVKIRIDRARAWLGSGQMLTQENLFPPPAYDYGYDLLLKRTDIFKGDGCIITKYI